MNYQSILDILYKVKNKKIKPEDAYNSLCTEQYKEMENAILDYQRPLRTGFPEAIYAKGKTKLQLLKIVDRLYKDKKQIIITKMSDLHIEIFKKNSYNNMKIYDDVGVGVCNLDSDNKGIGNIAVVTGGTSDYKIAEESAIVAEAMGSNITRIYDVGVAGLHRLFSKLEILRKANVIVAIAGMEGALPSVVSGLVTAPIIAVPTSVGYGASFGGLSALLTMLNSCAPGISVVNIDNGYGAAYQANLINILIERKYQNE